MTGASGGVPAWVRLRARDAGATRSFWGGVLGLEVAGEDREMRFVPPGGPEPVLLVDTDPGAHRAAAGAAGLYHLALRVPGRDDLARVLRRLQGAGVQLQGAADHLVSEALYLADPEGNGVEIYRDRPPDEWAWRDGEIVMDTRPLDVGALLGSVGEEAGLPAGTTLGHVHLRTTDLAAAEAFWTDQVGLGVTARSWPGALFLAAGRYHHHLGLNTWGRPSRSRPDATGLVETGWRVPGREGRAELTDPDGHRVVLAGGTRPRDPAGAALP